MLACWVTRWQLERLRKHLTTSINPPCPSHFLCLLLKRLDDLFSGKWLEVTGPGREIKARTATTQTKIPKRKRRKDGRNKKADPFLGFFFFFYFTLRDHWTDWKHHQGPGKEGFAAVCRNVQKYPLSYHKTTVHQWYKQFSDIRDIASSIRLDITNRHGACTVQDRKTLLPLPTDTEGFHCRTTRQQFISYTEWDISTETKE